MTSPAYYVSRIKAKTRRASTPDKFGKTDWQAHIKKLAGLQRKQFETQRAWTENRRLTDYDTIFVERLNQFFGTGRRHTSIADYLADMTHARKRKLTILEDGVGDGVIANDIKIFLQAPHRGVNETKQPHITGLTLKENSRTKFWKERRKLDEVHKNIGEFYVPKKQVDVILSTYGSIHYTPFPLLQDHLLKFAHSLKKGGLMMAVFDPTMRLRGGITNIEQWQQEVNYIKINKLHIENKFARMGFKAGIYENNDDQFVIVVQRIK